MRPMSQQADDFFLPNLCSPQAVFLLVIVAELFVLVLVLAWTGAGSFDWHRLALTSLFVQWIVLASAAVIGLFRSRLHRVGAPTVAIVSVGIILLVTSLLTLVAAWVFGHSGVSVQADKFWQGQWGVLLRNNLIALIIGTIVLRYFYLQNALSRQRQAELHARIQSLQSRIQPHFLFNSMNTIASLIATRPQIAERVVEDLADLFRASLNDASVLVPLDQEIALASQYLNIEVLRFGERLTIHWELPELRQDLEIPRLCLQPILENAVYHGIQPDPRGGQVKISVIIDDKVIKFTVCNTLPELFSVESVPRGHQMALQNIADRLHAIYGQMAYLHTGTFQQDNRRWYKTTIHCPLE